MANPANPTARTLSRNALETIPGLLFNLPHTIENHRIQATKLEFDGTRMSWSSPWSGAASRTDTIASNPDPIDSGEYKMRGVLMFVVLAVSACDSGQKSLFDTRNAPPSGSQSSQSSTQSGVNRAYGPSDAGGKVSISQTQSGSFNSQRMSVPIPANGIVDGITQTQAGIMNRQEMDIGNVRDERTRPAAKPAGGTSTDTVHSQNQSGHNNVQTMDVRKAEPGVSVLQQQSGSGRVQSLVVDNKKIEAKSN